MDTEPLSFENAAEWEHWLAGHHDLDGGAWLKIAKRGSGVPSITSSESLDVALCYGWIDSQRRSLDDTHFLQRYSRRQPRSPWSRINVEKAEALIEAGRMREPGFTEIEAAKADGRWDRAYESQQNATVPPDLAAALAANDAADRAFRSLGKSERYAILLPLLKAANDADRAKRVAAAIARLESEGPDSSTPTTTE